MIRVSWVRQHKTESLLWRLRDGENQKGRAEHLLFVLLFF